MVPTVAVIVWLAAGPTGTIVYYAVMGIALVVVGGPIAYVCLVVLAMVFAPIWLLFCPSTWDNR